MINTNYNQNVAGALKLITVNGDTYQLGNDASATEGGIVKLFGGAEAFESYKTSTIGTYDAKTVYDEIAAINAALGTTTGNTTIAQQVAAAKSTIALAANEPYLALTSATNATDGHTEYTLSTTGIDNAISTAIANVVNGADSQFDTLKEIADWILADNTGAAAVISSKADKVSNATTGNFAGLDANGNLTDSGSKASDFVTVASYVHTDNNYTTAEKNKLAAISASVSNDTLIITTQAA